MEPIKSVKLLLNFIKGDLEQGIKSLTKKYCLPDQGKKELFTDLVFLHGKRAHKLTLYLQDQIFPNCTILITDMRLNELSQSQCTVYDTNSQDSIDRVLGLIEYMCPEKAIPTATHKAQCVETRQWVHGFYFYDSDTDTHFIRSMDSFDYEVRPKTICRKIMHFKDGKGQDIYEHDKVHVCFRHCSARSAKRANCTGIVKPSKYGNGHYVQLFNRDGSNGDTINLEGDAGFFSYDMDFTELEVYGTNIL